jgi:hypothetical protein
MLAQIASIFPTLSLEVKTLSNPTIVITPAKATKVPIQNIFFGFSFKIMIAPIPTQTGARFASRVDMAAFESNIEVFQRAMSQAKKTPHRTAVLIESVSFKGRFLYNHSGNMPNVPINMR